MTTRNPNSIVFRADASLEIGTGHVVRCLAFGAALRARGWNCHFVTRDLAGNLSNTIRERGFELHLLRGADRDVARDGDGTKHAAWLGVPQGCDAEQSRNVLERINPVWAVVDHYSLDASWESRALPAAVRLMAIDDLADRPHQCDILLDHNYGRTEEAYDGLVPEKCARLIGPRYALLRPEFAARRTASLQRRNISRPEEILVSMGGLDQCNATAVVLDALAAVPLPNNCRITVVLGRKAPWLSQIIAQAGRMPVATDVIADATDMANLMNRCDLAVGAAGVTSWERCCLGLPTLLVIVADNQIPAAEALTRAGAACLLGRIGDRDLSERLRTAVTLLGNGSNLADMASRAAEITDGAGVQRCVDALLTRNRDEDRHPVL